MKKVFIIYTTDVWHTRASQELIGASASLEGAIALIKKYCKKEKLGKLSEDDLHLLKTIKQTQNFEGGLEFLIEEVTLEELH
jgi:hypothetical protein